MVYISLIVFGSCGHAAIMTNQDYKNMF